MNLVIDIGNTRVKTAVFNRQELTGKQNFPKKELLTRLQKISKTYSVNHSILSTVDSLDKDLRVKINQIFPVHFLSRQTKLPFNNLYKTPATLGVDRIALVSAAVNQFPGQNVLVIDAGSCITYDHVDTKRNYYGGSISPGIEMRYKALHHYTANLPELKIIDPVPKLGDSTDHAIHKGVLNGIILEIEGIINQFKQKNQKLTVVLTGGDTNFLAKNIKSTIFANPNFLLEGLNGILTYNIDE